MSEADVAGQIVAALGAAAEGAPLVSVEITWLGTAPLARVDAKIVRKTRTLLFASADALAADGARLASASSVHRVD
jgi:hypothetical protein